MSNVASLAQTPPAPSATARPDAGQLLREAAPAPLARPPATRPLIQSAPAAAALPAGTERILIKKITLIGNTRISNAELEPLLAGVLGQSEPQLFAGVQAAAARITELYRVRGYFLARAFIPRQSMAAGDLRIQIVEGVVGEIKAADGSARKESGKVAKKETDTQLLQNILAAQGQQVGEVIQEATLERAILLFAERGYLDADLGLSPGKDSGTTVLAMRWREERAPWAAALGLDNNGSRYTGTIRALGDAVASSLFTQGDEMSLRTSFTGFAESGDGSTQYLGAGYKLPLGFDGWRIGANASALRYELGGSFAALQATGRATTFGLNASYPLYLSSSTQSLLELGLQSRRAVDDSLAGNVNDKSSRAAVLIHTLSHSGASDDVFGGKLGQRLQTAFTAGRLDLSRNAGAAAFDAANAAAQGSYSKLRFDYVAAYALAAGHQLQGRLSHQFANKNLDSSEKFTLGGSSGVRAYPTGEANGDGGTLLSLEWRADISRALSSVTSNVTSSETAQGLAASVATFIDWGRIQQHQKPWAAAIASSNTTGIPNSYSLSGAGVTFSLARPGDWQLSATLAAPLGKNPGRGPQNTNSDGRAQHARAWLSFQKYF